MNAPGAGGKVRAAAAEAAQALLAERTSAGHWEGWLSSSALSTATAVCALSVLDQAEKSRRHLTLIEQGLEWLAGHQNEDGGWGDTTLSISNISTTALGWAAFGAVPGADARFGAAVQRAEQWLWQAAGGKQVDLLVEAITRRYGKDRTFSVPILTMCALGGRLGPDSEAWQRVVQLPFELAVVPPGWFALLKLPVVSYALPALIAIGLARHIRAPSQLAPIRAGRNLVQARALRVLEGIQPSNGGFLEATPLTSFVTMSLASAGFGAHGVVQKAASFLRESVRPDGSWPIDTNLATWVTTLSVNALGPLLAEEVSGKEQETLLEWLLEQQYQKIHPYTQAPPGAWAWTPLPGGVPDADDTASALLALHELAPDPVEVLRQAEQGLIWLLNLQNRDGGIPTFCRGWGHLPFDRSSPDLTAHALRAWNRWLPLVGAGLQKRLGKACRAALRYLADQQSAEGGWIPLWFGNQFHPEETNEVYGTSRVLVGLAELSPSGWQEQSAQAAQRLLAYQQSDGGWNSSSTPSQPSSMEETALAVEALAAVLESELLTEPALCRQARTAVCAGAEFLADRVKEDRWRDPSPIGFYFAKLWYYERLYPLIFTAAALRRARGMTLSQ